MVFQIGISIFSEIALTQPIASLGVAVVGLSEGKENSRIFGQVIIRQ